MIVLIITAVGCYFYQFNQNSGNSPNYELIATVTRVIDGDTIEVEIIEEVQPRKNIDTGLEKVRLACIDTEELSRSEAVDKHEELENISNKAYKKTKYYEKALKAKNILESLLSEGRKIYLDLDDLAYGQGQCRGYYGRLIAVVFTKDNDGWTNINAKMVEEQYSSNSGSRYPLSLKYKSEFSPYDWLDPDYQYLN